MKIKTKYLTILSYHENFEISPPILLFLFFSEKSQESAAVKTVIMKSDQSGLRSKNTNTVKYIPIYNYGPINNPLGSHPKVNKVSL